MFESLTSFGLIAILTVLGTTFGAQCSWRLFSIFIRRGNIFWACFICSAEIHTLHWTLSWYALFKVIAVACVRWILIGHSAYAKVFTLFESDEHITNVSLRLLSSKSFAGLAYAKKCALLRYRIRTYVYIWVRVLSHLKLVAELVVHDLMSSIHSSKRQGKS